MTYVERVDLFVGTELADVVESEALPATGIDPDALLERTLGADPRSRAAQRRTAGDPRDPAGSNRRMASPERRRNRTTRWRIARCSKTSAISCPLDRRSRSTPIAAMPRSPRSPGRSWSCRSPTPATRSTPRTPAGDRCTTRSYGTDALGTPPPAGPYDPARGRSCHRLGTQVPRRGRAAGDRQWRSAFASRCSSGTSIADGSLVVDVRRRRDRPCLGLRLRSSDTRATRPAPELDPARAPRARHRDRDRSRPLHRQHRRRRRGRRGPGVGDHIDHGLRGLDRRGRQRRQGARLSQLARPRDGHADGGGDQERDRPSLVASLQTVPSPLPMGRN